MSADFPGAAKRSEAGSPHHAQTRLVAKLMNREQAFFPSSPTISPDWYLLSAEGATHTSPGQGGAAAAALGIGPENGRRARCARVAVPACSRSSRAPVYWRLFTQGGARQGGLALGWYAFGPSAR